MNSGSVGPFGRGGSVRRDGVCVHGERGWFRAFRAHYEGDATYPGSDGACEPLQVVDANIQITPNGVNRVGDTHTFTAHVNVNDGTGFVNAPDGTQISFTIDAGPGSFTSRIRARRRRDGLLHDRPVLGGDGCDDRECAHDGVGRWRPLTRNTDGSVRTPARRRSAG